MNTEDIKGSMVLVVDDSPTNLSVLFNYLNEMGLKVLVAQGGESAVEQVAYERPDIILLDVLMPGIDGFETCRRLKANAATRDIPVIFMTALSDKEDIITGFEVGAVDYIPKPIHQEEVLARITTHLMLQRQRVELYKLNATKNKFFSIVAHELKEAFATLVSLSGYLVLSAPEGDIRNIQKAAKMVENSVQNSVKLLENLLNWANIQSGAIEFHPKTIDLQKIVLENIVLLRGTAREKQIKLSHSIAANTFVYTDYNTASMILNNLISNALWFTDKDGEVKVSANVMEHFVEVAVSDTGIGISEQNIRKLFRIDKKFKKSGTAGEHGTGLGLILCKELIGMNGGEIWIESEVGQGTTFRFTLPRRSGN
jgi:two-component system sensor histidine kinase/response regulator